MRFIPIIGIIVSCSLMCATQALASSRPERQPAWPGASIDLDTRLGTPRAIRFAPEAQIPNWKVDRVRAVREFLAAHGEIFGLRDGVDELRVERQFTVQGITHVKLQQYFRGVPVLNGGFNLSISPEGRPGLLLGTFVPNLKVAVGPRMTAVAAKALVPQEGRSRSVDDSSPRLVVAEAEESPTLAYEVYGGEQGHPLLYHVDAASGEVVQKLDLLSHVSCPNVVPATGNVFPLDARDSTTLVQRPLGHMTSSDLLKGCYIGHVHNVVFSHPVRANQLYRDPVGTDGNFQFPASSEFTAAVNAYYHIDRFFGAIEGMGYPHAENIGTGNISVFVNEGLDTLGSTHSDFVSRELHFTRPYVSSNALIQRNAALAADVLYHEAQHFVTLGYGMSFGPLTPQVGTRGHENVALQEGLSDYMAAAFTGDPHINEYLVVRCSTVTAHGDSTAGRWLDSDRTVVNYTNYARVSGCDSGPGNPHAAGMILSGALWDLRKVIGAQADTLVIEALAYLPDQPDFACMKDAMYQVAFDHHGGANSFRILSAFTRRHIKGCTVEIAQNSDPVGETRTVLYNQPTTFRALDLCGRVPLSTATWSLADLCDPSCPEFVAIPDDDIYDDAVTIAVAGDKRLRMRAETIFGAVDEDVVELIVDPTIVLQGEGTLTRTRGVCCPIGSFTAVASGRPPIAYQWRLDHQICASCGTDSVMSRPFCVDATVTCRITDANGRSKQASIRVSLAGSCTAAGTVSLSIAEGGGRVVNGAIQFGVPGPGQIVEVQVVDVAGRVVARPWMGILQGEQEHRVVWDARTLRPGMYFYRIKAGEQRVAQKFALVR